MGVLRTKAAARSHDKTRASTGRNASGSFYVWFSLLFGCYAPKPLTVANIFFHTETHTNSSDLLWGCDPPLRRYGRRGKIIRTTVTQKLYSDISIPPPRLVLSIFCLSDKPQKNFLILCSRLCNWG